jgi:hypothetical protein
MGTKRGASTEQVVLHQQLAVQGRLVGQEVEGILFTIKDGLFSEVGNSKLDRDSVATQIVRCLEAVLRPCCKLELRGLTVRNPTPAVCEVSAFSFEYEVDGARYLSVTNRLRRA